MNSSTQRVTSSATDRIGYGAIHLDVTDRTRSVAFWREAVGLVERDAGDDQVILGTPERDLVVLHPGAQRGVQRGYAGLYHLALHVPTEAEFARTIARFALHRVGQSPTDHIFSKATYVTDPDGITVEVTFETPDRFAGAEISGRSIALIDDQGRRRGPTEALDLAPVMALYDEDEPPGPMDAATTIGHIHLYVGDLGANVAFYRDVVGFDEHMIMDAIGMADMSAGGVFPHRLAMNIWQGVGVPPAPLGTAGMRAAEMLVRDSEALSAIAARAGVTVDSDGTLDLRDPAGNRIRLTHDAAADPGPTPH